MWFVGDVEPRWGSLLPRSGQLGLALETASVADENAHAAAGAGDHGHGGLDGGAVEVGHLLLGDLAKVLLADGGDLVTLGHAGGLVDAAGLLDKQG